MSMTVYEIPSAPEPSRPNGFRFEFLTGDDLLLKMKPMPWLIRGLLPERGLCVVFGKFESAKSFLVIDWLLSVATGRAWAGFDVVDSGLVALVLGEGKDGVARRLAAWQTARESITGAPILVSQSSAAMDDPQWAQAVSDAIHERAQALNQPVKLVVVDTLSRNFGGDENSTRDMAQFVRSLDTHFRDRFGCCVLVVHHTGHGAGERARGSSVLLGAADAEFRVTREPETNRVTVQPLKAKDWEAERPLAFDLRIVELAMKDDLGRPLTSCILDPVGVVDEAAPAPVQPLSERQRLALKVLDDLYQQHRDRLSSNDHDPDRARVLTEDWRHAMREAGVTDRRRWADLLSALKARELVREAPPYILRANQASGVRPVHRPNTVRSASDVVADGRPSVSGVSLRDPDAGPSAGRHVDTGRFDRHSGVEA